MAESSDYSWRLWTGERDAQPWTQNRHVASKIPSIVVPVAGSGSGPDIALYSFNSQSNLLTVLDHWLAGDTSRIAHLFAQSAVCTYKGTNEVEQRRSLNKANSVVLGLRLVVM